LIFVKFLHIKGTVLVTIFIPSPGLFQLQLDFTLATLKPGKNYIKVIISVLPFNFLFFCLNLISPAVIPPWSNLAMLFFKPPQLRTFGAQFFWVRGKFGDLGPERHCRRLVIAVFRKGFRLCKKHCCLQWIYDINVYGDQSFIRRRGDAG
jgi:hypothetical protein